MASLGGTKSDPNTLLNTGNDVPTRICTALNTSISEPINIQNSRPVTLSSLGLFSICLLRFSTNHTMPAILKASNG